MRLLVVVNSRRNWPLHIPGVEVVNAKSYLTDSSYAGGPPTRVFNLCTSYRYQSTGYYVSLLAQARGHRPMPDVSVLRDLTSTGLVKSISSDLEESIQRSLKSIKSDKFELSIYFGKNLARRHDRLALEIFNLFRTPMMRAFFSHDPEEGWIVDKVTPIGFSSIPDNHLEFLAQAATEYFSGRRHRVRPRQPPAWYLAILASKSDPNPPSDERALKKFVRAAERLGIEATVISRDDINRLPEYDALFIRETTQVNNHTYRFARRAKAEGLVVVDDPESILRCTNKVYLAELLSRHKIRTPKSIVIHRENLDEVAGTVGLPCIIKAPDSSFSAGVFKVRDMFELFDFGKAMLEKSELIIAQEFLPTPFDWRIGIFDNKPLYACKYFMAGRHWQIVDRVKGGKIREGRVETMPVEEAPEFIVHTALKATRLIGNSLYGVDLKEIDGKCYVIEINDNPSIDSGSEDLFLKDELYDRVMRVFLERLEARSARRLNP